MKKSFFVLFLVLGTLFFTIGITFAQVPGAGIGKDMKIKIGKYYISGDDANMLGVEYALRFTMPLVSINAGIEADYGKISIDKNIRTFAPGSHALEKVIFIKGVGTLYLPKLLGGMGVFSPYIGLSYGYYINSMYLFDTSDNETVKGFGGSFKIGLDFSLLGFGAFAEFERVFNDLESTKNIPIIGSTKITSKASGNILWIGVRF
ncbi:hypothetical protein ACFL4T_01890 [candidate division KSB1 bacterium]